MGGVKLIPPSPDKTTIKKPRLVRVKGSIAYGQVIRFKRICSTEEKLNNHPKQLKQWLVKRGYRVDHVDSQIERIKLVERTASFQIQDKKVDDNITLVPTYLSAVNQLYESLRRAHKHVLKSPRLYSGLPSPQRVAFRNPVDISWKARLPRKNTVLFFHLILRVVA